MQQIDRQEIETVFTANMKQLETALIRYSNTMEASARRQDRAWRNANRNIARGANKLNQDLRKALALGAIAVAGREIIEYEATWRNLSNTLNLYTDVLGPAAQAASRLNAVAIAGNAPIAELGNLTGATTRAVRAMPGAFKDSAGAVFGFAEAVSKGAQISNNGAAAVSGALIQLSQAIGSPRVQLGEFNSIIEGTPRLAQAFADGIDGAGGSVAKLRAMIAAGDVSGEDLIKGLLTQTDKLREEFAGMTTGASEAFTRLQNRIAEYVGTNQTAVDAQQALAGAIDFVSNNLDALTDAIIVGGAALAGWFGAQAAATVVASMASMTAGVTGFQRALALLKGVSAVFGGPLVIGVTAAAAAIAYFALKGDEATEAMDKLEKTLSDYRKTGERVQADTAKLKTLNDELTAAIDAQQEAIALTKRAEISALEERISKNGELLEIQRLLARSELGRVQDSVASFSDASFGDRVGFSVKGQVRKSLFDAAAYDDSGRRRTAAAQQETFLALLDEQVSRNQELESQGIKLTDRQRALYDIKADYLKLLQREKDLAEQVADVSRPRNYDPQSEDMRGLLGQGQYRNPNFKWPETKSDSKDKPAKTGKKDPNLKIVEDLQESYQALFDTEREAIDRTLALQLAAIEKAKLSDAQRSAARLQAEAIYSDAVGKLNAEEAEYADAAAKRRTEAADKNKALLAEAVAVRDSALGRTLAVLEAEYEAQKAYYEKEITDKAARNAALAALEETHNQTVADLRQEALADGRAFTEKDRFQLEIDQMNADAQARIDAIQLAYDGEIELHKEAQDQILAIQEEAKAREDALKMERVRSYVDGAASMFGDLAGIIEDFGGKQSGAYKALIGIQRAFTFASLTMNIAQGIGEAIKMGFPQNIPFIAGLVSQGAQAMSILAGAKGFQRGGETGPGADSDVRGFVHANEYVADAPTVRHYGVDVFEAIRKRKIPREALRGYQSGGYVGHAPPAIQRLADRMPQLASTAVPIYSTVNDIRLTQGPVTVNAAGGDPKETAAMVRAELAQSEARVLSSIPALVSGDIARGGGTIAEAIERAYALGRQGL